MNDSRDSFYRASGSSPPMADAKVNPGSGARWKRTSMFVDGNIYFPIELLGGLAVLSAMVDGADTLHSLGHDFVNIDWIHQYAPEDENKDLLLQLVAFLRNETWAEELAKGDCE